MFLSLILPFIYAATLPVGGISSIEVQAKEATITVQANTAGFYRWASNNNSDWEVEEKDGRLYFTALADDAKNLQIVGPSRNLKIINKKGKVSISKWQAALAVKGLDLDVLAKDIQGDISVYSHRGQIRVEDTVGNLDLHLGKTDTVIERLKGKLDLNQFSGNLRIQDYDGEANVKNQKAKVELKDSQGRFVYSSLRGDFLVNNYSGSLRGNSGSGMNILRPAPNAKVYWRAEQGGLRLGVKKISGAYVDIATKEGALFLVPPLRAKNEGIWRVARAKLQGSPSASVRIRTEKADVRVKYE
tara:strand:- start:212 stop:1114 length:903 start_codon:yes stop_codon:yes gene_type:complete